MAETFSAPGIGGGSSMPAGGPEEKLPKWLIVSFFAHGAVILLVLALAGIPSGTRKPPPSYVVDLVGGEKIGGRSLGTVVTPLKPAGSPKAGEAPPAPAKALPKVEKAPPPVVKKEAAKKEAAPPAEKPRKAPPPPREEKKAAAKPEKAPAAEKAAKAKAPSGEEVVLGKNKNSAKPEKAAEENAKPSAAKKEPAAAPEERAAAEENSLDRVRERLIQSAVERARTRAAAAQAAGEPRGRGTEIPLSAGSGEGLGAQSLGKGGIGGEGVLKSVAFIAYQNQLVTTIKKNWAWAGRRSDLKVVVHFGIKENGEIAALKITAPSGDPTYDQSVLRAIRKSNPFAAPPENHRDDFADIEMTFKPSDFGA